MVALDGDQDVGRVVARRAVATLPPAPASGADPAGIIDEDDLARLRMVRRAAAEIDPRFGPFATVATSTPPTTVGNRSTTAAS
jgi:hypothetical protein